MGGGGGHQTQGELGDSRGHSFMLCRHPSFGRVKTNMDEHKYGWTGKKIKEQKRSSQTIDIVSYALKVSVNGVTCVSVAHFRASDTFVCL